MATYKASWSRPDGIPGLIGRKQVDRSTFRYGSHIPIDFHPFFTRANGGQELKVGETHEVVLEVESSEYAATLARSPRSYGGEKGERLEIRYESSRGFLGLLREQLAVSVSHLGVDKSSAVELADEDDDQTSMAKPRVPDHLAEYIEFYETGTPFRYRVNLVPAQDPATNNGEALWNPPPPFEAVWAELGAIIGDGLTIYTLAQGAPNRIQWKRDKGIEVATARGADILPKALFESTWQALVDRGILIAEHMPGEARYRNAAISAIFGLLPHVDYTIHPRIALFLTSHMFTNAELTDTFKVGTQGGIRHAGQADNPKLVLFITGEAGPAAADHPYHDRWAGDTFQYCGEGLEGDQKMSKGNLALNSNIARDFPVYGFLKRTTGGYRFMGRFKVQETLQEQQPDSRGTARQVFIFSMRRVPGGTRCTRGRPNAWIFQANPKYYDLRGALTELEELSFLVNQYRNEIRAGDTVFLWEAGSEAGVVAIGTVITDPASTVQTPQEQRFNRDQDKFAGEQWRVRVRREILLSHPIRRQSLLEHPVLENVSILKMQQGTNFKLTLEEEQALHNLLAPTRPPVILRLPAPRDDSTWEQCIQDSALYITGWDELGDLRAFASQDAFDQSFAELYAPRFHHLRSLARRRSAEVWLLRDLGPGDHIVVTRGVSTVMAVGTVVAPGYGWDSDRTADRHTVQVQWNTAVSKRIPRQPSWAVEVVSLVSPDLFDLIQSPADPSPPSRPDLNAIQTHFASSLLASNISFGPRHQDVVRSFVASLATKRLVILTGLSGSGKTQIALRFGQWLGEGRSLVVPVRPDWTGAEALFGYEDALKPTTGGRSAWYVPPALKFMLDAVNDPEHPYLLVLDEMNLAHVERYFADVLSGMESGEACLPNLQQDDQGSWRLRVGASHRVPVPENLFVVGTVNVDETTYLFSPKVLDRANTFEFRVRTEELSSSARKPLPCEPGDPDLVKGFLAISADDEWHEWHPAPRLDEILQHIRTLHQLLAADGFEFGHRVFYEAVRYASMLAAAGDDRPEDALDQQVLQKVLPRLHGTRKRLENTLCALAQFCFDPATTTGAPNGGTSRFDPERPPVGVARLPQSFDKIQRMTRSLRTNQFTSFTE